MPIPLSTTTVTVRRPPPADDYAEPYSGTRIADLVDVATGIPAVIDVPVARAAGRETTAGGEQTDTEFRFACELCDLKNTDYLLDDATGVTYRITWCFEFHGAHIEGGLKLVEGLV